MRITIKLSFITWLFLSFFIAFGVHATPLDEDPEYIRRSTEATRQLRLLIEQNAENDRKGLSYLNHYIFSDVPAVYDYIKTIPNLENDADGNAIKVLELLYGKILDADNALKSMNGLGNRTGAVCYVYLAGLQVANTNNISKDSYSDYPDENNLSVNAVAEEVIISEDLVTRGIPSDKVTRIYSELEFCYRCSQWVDSEFSNLQEKAFTFFLKEYNPSLDPQKRGLFQTGYLDYFFPKPKN